MSMPPSRVNSRSALPKMYFHPAAGIGPALSMRSSIASFASGSAVMLLSTVGAFLMDVIHLEPNHLTDRMPHFGVFGAQGWAISPRLRVVWVLRWHDRW